MEKANKKEVKKKMSWFYWVQLVHYYIFVLIVVGGRNDTNWCFALSDYY
jgi:hypothetical protein